MPKIMLKRSLTDKPQTYEVDCEDWIGSPALVISNDKEVLKLNFRDHKERMRYYAGEKNCEVAFEGNTGYVTSFARESASTKENGLKTPKTSWPINETVKK